MRIVPIHAKQADRKAQIQGLLTGIISNIGTFLAFYLAEYGHEITALGAEHYQVGW